MPIRSGNNNATREHGGESVGVMGGVGLTLAAPCANHGARRWTRRVQREAGIAFAVGCPVVLYKDDARSAFSGRDNAMLLGLAASPPVAKLEELRAAVERVLSRPG